ncbi:MAG: J domain-containing protein [Kiritimatiellae bacterium]|nr:J domain-containing protein [Kiritimatiellia bacterium]
MARSIPSLSVEHLARAGVLGHARPCGWLLQWPAGTAGVRQVACLVVSDRFAKPQTVLLRYRDSRTRTLFFYGIGLHAVDIPGRGARYVFQCPAVINGNPCLRTADQLVLLGGSRPIFACDECARRLARHAARYRKRTAGAPLQYGVWPRIDVSPPALPAVSCPSCNRSVSPENFCSSCGTTLKERPPPDPYAVLELDRSALSRESLRKAYRRKVMEYHPDRVALAGAKIRRLAEQETAEINRAYKTLSGAVRQG